MKRRKFMQKMCAANAVLARPFREKWLDKHVIDWMNKYQDINLR